MGRLLALKTLLKSGRLALRLARDNRVPLYAKAVLGVTVLYALSPLDLVPDWLPVLGQLDDIAALGAGLALFIRLCPPDVVAEHEDRLGITGAARRTIDGIARPADPPSASGRGRYEARS